VECLTTSTPTTSKFLTVALFINCSDSRTILGQIAALGRDCDKTLKLLPEAGTPGARSPCGIEISQELQWLRYVAANLESSIKKGGRFIGGWEGGVGAVR